MPGPLSSLKVLDFTTLLPGPYATMMLADMGAEVLRVESPTRTDLTRVMPPHDQGVSTAHSFLNRGKRCITLDLKKPENQAVVKSLVADFDIVVEQFRPGVMDRLGLGYEVLQDINPSLIYCAITGYGQTGPYRDRAGHDINYLSLAGVSGYSGRAQSGPPPLGIQVADVAGGSHHAVMGILAAVVHRTRTGEGQFVDVSMTDAAFALNGMTGAGYLGAGREPGPETEMLNGGSFYDYYQTADDRWLSVGSLEPQFLERVCQLIARPELARFGLSPNPDHQRQLKSALKEAIGQRTLAEWRALFAETDACVEPVLSLAEAAQHPQIVARQMVIQVPRGDGSTQSQIGFPIKFERTPCHARYTGKVPGADNEAFLGNQSPE